MLKATRFASLIGLAFGDCGKGIFTDALSRRWHAHTVVRYNGGAQAGHNVVLPDGRHHTFSQFGAASFNPWVSTVLAAPVVVHPTALEVEERFLQRAGVADGFERLLIDGRCRVTTPYHQAAGRLREWGRGALAHGSCGVGVGETVRHALAHADEALHYEDLRHRPRARHKLLALRRTLAAEFDLAHAQRVPAWADEARALGDDSLADRWLAQVCALAKHVPPVDREQVAARLSRPGTVLFEGAQGMLLDEWHGFHPHTTWSNVGPQAVQAVLEDLGLYAPVQHFGLLRSYLTRHGAGPLPTHDTTLDVQLDALNAEPHNTGGGWQGAFRRGHPDALLLAHALTATGPLQGLLVSHLDALDRGVRLRWCEAYEMQGGTVIEALPRGADRDLAHQQALTQTLQSARPRYAPEVLATPEALVERLAAATGLPVRGSSCGPTHADVRWHPLP